MSIIIPKDKNGKLLEIGDSIHYENKVLKLENIRGVAKGVEYFPNGRINKTKAIGKIDFSKAEKVE